MKATRKARFPESDQTAPPRRARAADLQQQLLTLHHLLLQPSPSPCSFASPPPSPSTLVAFLDREKKSPSTREKQLKDEVRSVSKLLSTQRRRLKRRGSRNEEVARRARETLGAVLEESWRALERDANGVLGHIDSSEKLQRMERGEAAAENHRRAREHINTPPSAPPHPLPNLPNPLSPTPSALAFFSSLNSFPRSPEAPVLIDGQMQDHATWAREKVAALNQEQNEATRARDRGAGQRGEQLVVVYGAGVVELMTVEEEGEVVVLWRAEGVEHLVVQSVSEKGVRGEMNLWAEEGW